MKVESVRLIGHRRKRRRRRRRQNKYSHSGKSKSASPCGWWWWYERRGVKGRGRNRKPKVPEQPPSQRKELGIFFIIIIPSLLFSSSELQSARQFFYYYYYYPLSTELHVPKGVYCTQMGQHIPQYNWLQFIAPGILEDLFKLIRNRIRILWFFYCGAL